MFEPTRRVFQTPELLQLIFERLDTNDLLSSRTVCKHFASSITASPQLAVQLFHRDRERPKPLMPKWLSKVCKVAVVQQCKGRDQVVLHLVWSPRRRKQLSLIQNSAFLGKMLLAQPVPNLLRISRICNCLDNTPLVNERLGNGDGPTIAHLAHAILHLPTELRENPCVCSCCGADGKLRVVGERIPVPK
ncbi:hypothetical protein Q7P37_004901 [Cladosporium fusiforme]